MLIAVGPALAVNQCRVRHCGCGHVFRQAGRSVVGAPLDIAIIGNAGDIGAVTKPEFRLWRMGMDNWMRIV